MESVANVDSFGNRVLAQFFTAEGVYDELRTSPGQLRPTWDRFLSHLGRTNTDELSRRWNQAQRLIRENGIAYAAYLDEDRQTRPWQLDALPFVISHQDWQPLEQALQQRARLLELVLADLYGPQQLIADGLLPPEILFANPGYWRAFHDHLPVGGSFLQFYAADMARLPNGTWCVLGDRSEAPSGIGFALENRRVLSRMFPTEFRECGVQRLAPFFQSFQDTLWQMAPRRREDPRVIILSEGPSSDNFFEDAYLARYLGYQLVDGADLTVRNQRVFIKTLGGLRPVDVILRRLSSDQCDPLELDEASSNGVVGLMQSARIDNVAIFNALGSGLVESPIMMVFLPRLCEALLGETLKLPSVETWWCGDPSSLQYVLAHLNDLTIKRSFRNRQEERDVASRLRSLTKSELTATIQQDPARYVAQQTVQRSAAPLWRGDDIQSAFVAMRTYVVATGDQFHVMPGGLTRTSDQLGSLETSICGGEGSKDTWVMSDTPAEPVSLLPRVGSNVEIRRSGADLPSRVADNVFWLGRYLERTDATARLLRTVILRLTNEVDYRSLPDLPHLVRALAHQGQIERAFAESEIRQQLPTLGTALPLMALDRNTPGSIRSVQEKTLRLAGKVRDRLSTDSWRILLSTEEQFRDLESTSCDLTVVLNLADALIVDLAAFSGTIMESMTRTQAFRFLDLGRRLERALQLIGMLENTILIADDIPSELLEAMLEVADSLMTYRSRYMANLHLSAVLDLLLTDETNPRSLAFQLLALRRNVDDLPRDNNLPSKTRDERLAMSMLHHIRMIDIEAICEHHSLGDAAPLHSLLRGLRTDLPLLSNAISDTYLVHTGRSQQLSDIRPNPQSEIGKHS